MTTMMVVVVVVDRPPYLRLWNVFQIYGIDCMRRSDVLDTPVLLIKMAQRPLQQKRRRDNRGVKQIIKF